MFGECSVVAMHFACEKFHKLLVFASAMEGSAGKSGGSGRDHRSAAGQPEVPGNSELAGMGLQLVIAIVLFLFVGRWIDSRFGTAPLFMIVGVFVGAGGSTFAMYRRIFPPGQTKPPTGPGRGES
jgi:hypothetical protein